MATATRIRPASPERGLAAVMVDAVECSICAAGPAQAGYFGAASPRGDVHQTAATLALAATVLAAKVYACLAHGVHGTLP